MVQWYGVNEVHESESMKAVRAEGGGGREIESTGGGLWCVRLVSAGVPVVASSVPAGGRAGGAFLRGVDKAEEALEPSSLLRLTGMEAACSRVAVWVSVTWLLNVERVG